jgi:hypothetical protein
MGRAATIVFTSVGVHTTGYRFFIFGGAPMTLNKQGCRESLSSLGELRALLLGLVSDAERQVSEAELRLTAYRKFLSFTDIQAAAIRDRLTQIEAAEAP